MTTDFGGTLSMFDNSCRPAKWTICLFLFVVISAPGSGRSESNNPLRRVLMLAPHDLAPDNSDLFRAIRAQLSATPLILDRIELDADEMAVVDPIRRAAKAANEHLAAMVFWIEDKEICRMFFYIPDADGGRINSRVLNVDFDSRLSRFEVIAIAAAGMIEELLVSRRLEPTPADQHRIPDAPPRPPPATVKPKNKWFEVFVAYAGSYFATNMVTHGVQIGLGVFPVERMSIAASFVQNIPLRLENRDFRSEILSQMVEVLAAGRFWVDPVDIRVGLAWSVDLRSYSTISLSEQISPKNGETEGNYSLGPFVSTAWLLTERIGLFIRLGVSFVLKDTNYKVQRGEQYVSAVSPFFAKFSYRSGVLIQL